ncbi:hypothetical protein SO802_015159 [Lithocarpus litseifolius]|uniref:Aminotransferase-like plant mobile domain-containing protein n=1 Tax=Lithocarpus litseifolius TaxID=425828 RepID=A0AAW2CV15_9ROSI
MLIPYDFFVITGLRLSGESILVNDSLTSIELKKLLGVVPFRMRRSNIPLSWLCENIPHCETVAKGARMFMLLFIGTFLCLDLGSTVNLRYLGSLRKIEQIRNYDWGGMANATLTHFITQLSRRGLSSLGGAPFVWMYEYFGVGPEIWEEVASIFPIFLHWLLKHRLSTPSKHSLENWRLVIDNLTAADAGCEGYAECERALELNGHQVLFECRHGRYWYLGNRVLPQVEHKYPPTIIPTPPCHTIRLADFLADEEIALTRNGYIVAGVERNYSEFIQLHLQAYKLEGIKALSNVKIKWDLFLRAAMKFWDFEDHMFRFNTVELYSTIEEFSAILGCDPSKKYVVVFCDPRHKESLSDALGLPTSITDSMIEAYMVNLHAVISRLIDKHTYGVTDNM